MRLGRYKGFDMAIQFDLWHPGQDKLHHIQPLDWMIAELPTQGGAPLCDGQMPFPLTDSFTDLALNSTFRLYSLREGSGGAYPAQKQYK